MTNVYSVVSVAVLNTIRLRHTGIHDTIHFNPDESSRDRIWESVVRIEA